MFKSFQVKISQNQGSPLCIVRSFLPGVSKKSSSALKRTRDGVRAFLGTYPETSLCSTSPVFVFFGKFPGVFVRTSHFSNKGTFLAILLDLLGKGTSCMFFIEFTPREVFPLAMERASMRCKCTTTIQLWTLVSATAVGCA